MAISRCIAMAAAIAVAVAGFTFQHAVAAAPDPVSGRWHAALVIPAGDVEFEIDLALKGNTIRGAILNGPDRLELSGGSYDGTTVTLRMDYYDGQIVARFDGANPERLVGEYSRQTRSGIGRYEFKAAKTHVAGRPKTGAPRNSPLDISGEWVMTVRNAEGKTTSVDDATFTLGPGNGDHAGLTGTVIPVSGDSGLLSGDIWIDASAGTGKAPRFKISRFDGIHVMLLTGELQSDGSLKGETASGLTYRAAWTAVRKSAVSKADPASPDPYTLTSVRNPDEPFAFSLPDTAGKTVSLTDKRYRGKVVVIDIFGTWCPNCHDSAPVLNAMYRKYRSDGLEVVGLAYEYTPDARRNARQIGIYRKKYGVDFPLLMAGTTNDGEIARTLPQLVNFGAYPTTIFIGRDGKVRKIHAGFSGPATGHRFEEVKTEWDTLIRELLAEKPGA